MHVDQKTVIYLQDIESETNLNIEYIDYILKVDIFKKLMLQLNLLSCHYF